MATLCGCSKPWRKSTRNRKRFCLINFTCILMVNSRDVPLIEKLKEAGAKVKVYDPVAMDECRRRLGDDAVLYCGDMYEAALDADALLLVTEWNQFRMPSLPVLKRTMSNPLIIDGRNIYDREYLEENGFSYTCIGK